MSFRKLLRTMFVVLCLSALLVSVAGAEETIKIGLLAPLTGKAADDGLNVKNSVEMAVEKLNAAGGVLGKKVELVTYDDRAEPKDAVALAHKLIEQDKIVGFVAGSYSFPTRAVAPIFQEAEVPLVAAYALHPDITKAGDYCFRNGFLGTVEGRGCAHVAVKMLGSKKLALIHADNDFGRTLAEGARKYVEKYAPDTKIVHEAVYPFAEKDYTPYLSKIKAENPDVIIASGYFFQMGPLLKQAREMGITAKIVGEEGADSPILFNIAGKAADGFIIVTNLDRDDKRPFVQEYLKQYKERYGIDTCMTGASGYDAFLIIINGIKTAGSLEPKKIRDAIAATKDFDGMTGVIKGFTPEREVVKPLQVQIVKDGNFRHYAVIDDPELIAQ